MPERKLARILDGGISLTGWQVFVSWLSKGSSSDCGVYQVHGVNSRARLTSSGWCDIPERERG